MSVISSENYIQCFFEPASEGSGISSPGKAEVFYGITGDLRPAYPYLENFLSDIEKERSARFHFEEDRNTYVCSHGLLRLILSKKLNKNPEEIVFIRDKYNKPGLSGNPLYFNITHSREAFAFAISESSYIGVDLENDNRRIDYLQIINTYFGKKERSYILGSHADENERFFLLWTRKEALLKAIGIGIIVNLAEINVSEKLNTIFRRSFGNFSFRSVSDEHFIYSEKFMNYSLSVALPQKARVDLTQIKENMLEGCHINY